MALRGLDSVGFDEEAARDILKEHHLDVSSAPERIGGLYERIEFVGGVWKATLRHDRPAIGLKAGDVIAVRNTHSLHKPLSQHEFYPIGLHGLVRLSSLNHPPEGQLPYTPYFPDFYGVYYGSRLPRSLVTGEEYPWFMKGEDICSYRYEEMEWVDSTFAAHFGNHHPLPDSVIFEFILGEWAGQTFVGIGIADAKWRNFRIKRVKKGRCYFLGDKAYYFPAGWMPVRLDLAEAYSQPVLPKKSFIFRSLGEGEYAETVHRKAVLSGLTSGTEGLFTLFESHFAHHQRSQKWVRVHDPEAHFFQIPQTAIDHENSLLKPD